MGVRMGTTLQAIAINVTSAGGAGTVVRLGARSEDPTTGQPGANSLLADWGTVDGATTGIKTLTISFVVPSDRLWITVTPQVGTAPTLGARNPAGFDVDGASASDVISTSAAPGILFQSGITGALPAGFTSAGSALNLTLVAVQAA